MRITKPGQRQNFLYAIAAAKIPLIILFFLIFTAAVFGVEVTIAVIDGDLNMALEGARIALWDGSERFTNVRGRAVLDVPGNRPVVIQVSYPGYESSRLSLQPGVPEYIVALHLGGIMEEREMVIEADRPDSGKAVSGRSVAISGRDLTRQAETGVVEDVMRAIKLLPGVGYVGGYMAMPSVRGGEPGDLTAVFDGFYVERPFHWNGAVSIFDPKMVGSAQLSHGVFSARYGHTISGLLNIQAKSPPRDMTEAELAISTSAANLNLSLPLGQRGGLSLMGRITYWDPFIETAKLFFDEVLHIATAPYIRSGALGIVYDFSTIFSFSLNGFFGGDGAAANYEDDTNTSTYHANFTWDNKIGFLTAALSYNPRQDILLKTRFGAGLIQSDLDAKTYSENRAVMPSSVDDRKWFLSDRTINAQGRFDLDWDWKKGFVFSAGVEERYSRWDRISSYSQTGTDKNLWFKTEADVLNQGLFSSLYSILEYKSQNRRFGMELGIRGDHFFLLGEDFVLKGLPTANPRLNLDFNILEDKGIIDSLTLTVGSGLFSSINSALQNISGSSSFNKDSATQNRSWTNVVGAKINFLDSYTFSLEGYVKNAYNRAYTKYAVDETGDGNQAEYYFNGKAFIWGFDCILQKYNSRYWDGWISYSYIDSKYKDPQSLNRSRNSGGWYYPGFHRFHTLNVIANYKPVPAVNLNIRFGLASGIPILKTESISEDPNVPGSPPPWQRIQKYDDNSRAGFIMPLDIKLSFFSFNKYGRVKRELYFCFENLLSLAYKPETAKDFDSNTGKESRGYSVASYDLPIPLLTFGIKWSY